MKKKLFGMLCMMGMVIYPSAQERIVEVETIDPAQLTCVSFPVSHWSLGIRTGLSKYLIPPDAIESSDRLKLMVGGLLEYTFNPFIGIGLEYDYNDYSRPYTYTFPVTRHVTKGDFTGITHDALLYGSVNLSNAFAPFREGFWKNLNIYGDLGGGVAFFHYAQDNAALKYREAMMGKIGLNAEITLSKSFNLSIAGQYNQYDTRMMSGSTALRNCDALLLTIGLRYKIGCGMSAHARNINLCEFSPKPVSTIIKETYVKGETDESLRRLKSLRDENASLAQRLQKMEDEAKAAAARQKPETKDLSLQQKLQKMETDLKQLVTKKEGKVNLSLENVEFKSGSNVLTDSSRIILNQVADILKKTPSWSKLTVAGHTDNVGSETLNLKLSKSRALSVKKYLVSKGVPSAKILTTGWGETDPIATNDTPEGRQKNRRVEFEIK